MKSFIFRHLFFISRDISQIYYGFVCVHQYCAYKSEKFPFLDFHLVKKREWLHQNVSKLSSYLCEQNLSTYYMSWNQSGKTYYFVLCSSMTKNPETFDANIELIGKTLKMQAWERRKQ